MGCLLLRAITAAGLLATFDAKGISGAANDLVPNTWQVANTPTTDQNDRVFLKVVPLARDVNGDFFAVTQADTRNFSQCRVRLFRRHRSNLQANTLLLRAFLKHGRLALAFFQLASFSDELVDRRHGMMVWSGENPHKWLNWAFRRSAKEASVSAQLSAN